jgi:hypothetical protein
VVERFVFAEDLKGLALLVVAVVCLDSDYSSVWSGLYKFFVCEVSVQRFYAAASRLVKMKLSLMSPPGRRQLQTLGLLKWELAGVSYRCVVLLVSA